MGTSIELKKICRCNSNRRSNTKHLCPEVQGALGIVVGQKPLAIVPYRVVVKPALTDTSFDSVRHENHCCGGG